MDFEVFSSITCYRILHHQRAARAVVYVIVRMEAQLRAQVDLALGAPKVFLLVPGRLLRAPWGCRHLGLVALLAVAVLTEEVHIVDGWTTIV